MNSKRMKITKSWFLKKKLFTGHFLGNETVIDRLKKQGYSIEHIQHDDSIPR